MNDDTESMQKMTGVNIAGLLLISLSVHSICFLYFVDLRGHFFDTCTERSLTFLKEGFGRVGSHRSCVWLLLEFFFHCLHLPLLADLADTISHSDYKS